MESQIVNQPMVIIAMSLREAKQALDDPGPLQAAVRREYLATQGTQPLALAAPTAVVKSARKMGGGKSIEAKTEGRSRRQVPVPALRRRAQDEGISCSSHPAGASRNSDHYRRR